MAKEVNALDALLGAETVSEQQVFIKRLNTYFTVKGISGEEFSDIQNEATYYEGQGAKRKKAVDENKMNWSMIVRASVDPNFADKRVLEKFGAKTAVEAAQKALFAGEMLTLTQAIMEVSGFQADVEEVKN